MKDPHTIILRPHVTERSVRMSYGDEKSVVARKRRENRAAVAAGKKAEKITVEEADLVRKYVFLVSPDANKIEIKSAIEAIYNEGKKKDQEIKVTSVRTIRLPGKKRRRGQKSVGYEPDRKKAIVTLAQGQVLEDYGV